MKTNTLFIFTIILILHSFVFASNFETNLAFASCAAETDYDAVLEDSELAFTGTVLRLDNYDGPQKVTFFIHEVIKGEIDTPKFIFENFGIIFFEDGSGTSSSVNVDYKIGKTYKVYVINGDTNNCTTKLTNPPSDYLWEPGPEDGIYYSETVEPPLRQYQDANERESYTDALGNGSIVLPSEYPSLTDKQLDEMVNKLYDLEFSHLELPIASIAIDYDRDILVFWTPDLNIGNKIKSVVGDTAFVLLYEEAPVRWAHDGPEPEPEQNNLEFENCGAGTTLQDGICVVNPENDDASSGVKWGDAYNGPPSPDLEPIRDHDYEFIYVLILLIFAIIGGTIGGVIIIIRRKRK